MENQREIHKNSTVYNFDTIDVDGKPEVQLKCLKKLVGERGFEPPTPWSRTRCSTRLSHSPTTLEAAPRQATTRILCFPRKHSDYNIATTLVPLCLPDTSFALH